MSEVPEVRPVVADPAEKPAEAPKEAEVPKGDEVLSFLNGVLKREFKTRDEAQKSIDNLNSMVGDNAVAELRTKAADADAFAKVISAYAKSEGLTIDEARKELITGASTPTMEEIKPVETSVPAPAVDTKQAEKVDMLYSRLQEKDLLEAYPEAKHVLDEVKAMAKLTGKEMKEYFEGSALKTAALAAKEKELKDNPSPNSNSRQGADLSSVQDLVATVSKGGTEGDRVALVTKALSL